MVTDIDRLLGIRSYFDSRVEAGLPCLPTIDQVEWLITEVERLRAESDELRCKIVRLADGGYCSDWDKDDD